MVKNLIMFLSLIIIGVFAHYPSSNLSLYGDDWLFIYRYFTHSGHLNTMLPGILTYLAPYGPSIFLIGTEYQIFGQNYFFYYLVALIFKIFASFALLLVVKKITKSTLISLLVTILFLVGFIGIQTTDWVFYMNVYLATGLFFLSLYFQFKFFETYKHKDLIYQLLFAITAIITAPGRLFPLILIIPLTEVILLFHKIPSNLLRGHQTKQGLSLAIARILMWGSSFLRLKKEVSKVLAKLAIFFIFIIILWLIGDFGAPGKIYSPYVWSGNWRTKEFFELIIKNPLYTLNSFLQSVGLVIYPNHPSVKIFKPELIGLSFVVFSILGLVFSRKERFKFNKVIIGCLIFFTPLIGMWFFSGLRVIDSPDRYLLFPFAGSCILIGVLSARFFNYFKTGIIFFLVILIGANFLATKSMYEYWLSKGRNVTFAKMVDKQILKDFPQPVTSPKIIYLDSDDGVALHSLQFGIGFRMLVLSNTWNDKYFSSIYNVTEKDKFIEKIAERINTGEKKQDVINSVYAYGNINNRFLDMTKPVREELSSISF